MNDYQAQAAEFLKRNGITFKSAATNSGKCPPFCDGKKHIHGEEYRITFRRSSTSERYQLRFWNSHNDVKNNVPPDAYSVLACLTKSAPGTFNDFCDEYGYDQDSRKAEKIYRAVVKEWKAVERFFSPEEIEELMEIN